MSRVPWRKEGWAGCRNGPDPLVEKSEREKLSFAQGSLGESGVGHKPRQGSIVQFPVIPLVYPDFGPWNARSTLSGDFGERLCPLTPG